MEPNRIDRNAIKHEINGLIEDALWDFSQTGDNIYPQVDHIMQMIEQYKHQSDKPIATRELTIAEQAIFALYRNYLMYDIGSKWTVNYQHYASPYGIWMEIKTNDFYGTNRKLKLDCVTFRNDPTKVWLCNFSQLASQARQHHIANEQFINIVQRFGIEIYQNQVQYAGHADGLENAFFKILNLARYLGDGHTELPTNQYVNANHIAKVFVKNKLGNVETRID